ncbi:chromosome replication/partitioning protein [Borrelia puertoricensis]|uniref:chromosome replication/partitioning protein n=1 Tax=Borrelia puertoricensis TaxID=2756107 RepID=UPI001FF5857E|nr:chromosome replication/partitioning protein [Borrelia puertoricensis]UPA18577.1 chromosome replication/partitioning protein [Borrelia puertoricensis]
MSKKLDLQVQRRNLSNDINVLAEGNNTNAILNSVNTCTVVDEQNSSLEYFRELKRKLMINLKDEIHAKIITMKILKEINDKELYLQDGYKTFSDFISEFNLARTQVYGYIRMASAISEGVLSEEYIIQNGIQNSLLFIRNTNSDTIKKSRQNPIKPLRFQLKNQESYDFYKQNAKFTSFLMDELFKDKKDLLEEFMKKFKSLKD